MSFKQAKPLWVLFAAVGTLCCGPAIAQESIEKSVTLSQPSLFDAVEHATKSGTYWSEVSLGQDVKNFFFIGSDEARIESRSRNFEGLYVDLMQQQNDNHGIIRTQDIPNLYSTSLLELQK